MSVLNTKSKYTNKSKMFLSNDMGVQRFDVLKYRQFDKLTEKQLGSFGDQKKLIFSKTQKTLRTNRL